MASGTSRVTRCAEPDAAPICESLPNQRSHSTVRPVQSSFRQYLKTCFAPMTRKLGFTGSGQKYTYADSDRHVQFGVQKSACSDSSQISFALNIRMIPHSDWDEARSTHPHYPKVPGPNTFFGVGLNKRISQLLPENRDLWWNYCESSDILTLTNVMSDVIKNRVLPIIHKQSTG